MRATVPWPQVGSSRPGARRDRAGQRRAPHHAGGVPELDSIAAALSGHQRELASLRIVADRGAAAI